jgi:hypothetical protein
MFTNALMYLTIPGFSIRSPRFIKALMFSLMPVYVPAVRSDRLERIAAVKGKRSILKKNLAKVTGDAYVPRTVPPVMNPDDSDDEDSYPQCVDRSDRKKALVRFAENEQSGSETRADQNPKKRVFRVGFGSLSVRSFAVLDSPINISMQITKREPMVSEVEEGFDHHAARAADVLLDDAMRGYDVNSLKNFCDITLRRVQEKIRLVSEEPPPGIGELKRLVLGQVVDLAVRCGDRIEILENKRQFYVKERTNQMGRKRYPELDSGNINHKASWLAFFRAVDEAEFAEDILTRVPDVLVQRYITKRANHKINKRLYASLQRLLRVLREDPSQSKGCSYPLMH